MLALDVRHLHRGGQLTPGQSWLITLQQNVSIQMRTEGDRVILNYRNRSNDGEWRPIIYPVYLEWTGCRLGGRRAWFLCPTPGCGRRVAILFGGAVFACRHCHKLAYESQRASPSDRAMRRADRIRRRLGWDAGIANLSGGKPKGMHWRTFARLDAELFGCMRVSLAATMHLLDQMKRRGWPVGELNSEEYKFDEDETAAIERAAVSGQSSTCFPTTNLAYRNSAWGVRPSSVRPLRSVRLTVPYDQCSALTGQSTIQRLT
ncbi:MAG: hypothetical protein Q8L71_11935 [Thiobacillus sp.]|nr:hypothetical protein [Thiobacillus sp.]